MALGHEEIESKFGVHATTAETRPKHNAVRTEFITMAEILDDLVPDGRDKSIMWTELENAAMRAHRAISHPNPLV